MEDIVAAAVILAAAVVFTVFLLMMQHERLTSRKREEREAAEWRLKRALNFAQEGRAGLLSAEDRALARNHLINKWVTDDDPDHDDLERALRLLED